MDTLPTTQATKHDELLSLVNPLIDYMTEHGYTYILLAGKDGICTRHLRGYNEELESILYEMCQKNPPVKKIITNVAEYRTEKPIIRTNEI
ncbi:MAG: hypothetical protein WAU01_14640 [Saprospiraceae bacterium]